MVSVLPISHSAAPALSSLISDYLSGVDHPIAVTTPFEFFADYIAHTTFPAAHPRPEVLHNVTIENMKVHFSGTTILASGIVHARLALPEGMDITIAPSRVLPDTLIFDGQPDPASTPPPQSPLRFLNTNRNDHDEEGTRTTRRHLHPSQTRSHLAPLRVSGRAAGSPR
jgi:hypothetical protein